MGRRVLVIAGVVVAVQLALAGRYGYHRDELYFLACGRRLAWGYVDQPPFVPAIARVADELLGGSVRALRVAPALANGATVVLAAVTARELGGGRRAQVLAATATAFGSVFLGTSHLLTTAAFDILAWAAIVALVVRILRTGEQRLWLATGAVAGVGLLNKHSVAFLLVALLLGLALARRDVLRSPWPWLGALVAVAIWSPNLVWQAQHDWPVRDMSESLRQEGIQDGNAFLFVPAQLLFLNPALAPMWIAGLVWLLRDAAARAFRPVAVAYLVLVVVFVATSGKPYYLAGLYPALLAAGGVRMERAWTPVATRRYVGAFAAVGLLGLPLALPLLPITAVGDGPVAEVNPEHRESYGWRGFAATVEGVPGAVVFTSDYGEAGAAERFGSRPAYSGHNNYWLWGPPPDDAVPVVVVGRFPPRYLDRHFTGCRLAAVHRNAAGVPNEEHGVRVHRCDGPRRPWSEEWDSLRHYDA